jgi:hypothetical protein
MDNCSNSRANTCVNVRLHGRAAFIRYKNQYEFRLVIPVIHNNQANRIGLPGDSSIKFLTYQLSTVGYWPTVAMTGNGELWFDSGEGA